VFEDKIALLDKADLWQPAYDSDGQIRCGQLRLTGIDGSPRLNTAPPHLQPRTRPARGTGAPSDLGQTVTPSMQNRTSTPTTSWHDDQRPYRERSG
jgi:hypothetical protein